MTLSTGQIAVDSLRTTTWNALSQKDVFRCILDCLAAPDASLKHFRESRRVLVSLAQTCRAFSEPSLDHLWSRLDSLEPLIRCFTTVLSEERAKALIGYSSRLVSSLTAAGQTPPSLAEWDIIRRYSHRIRELSIGPLDQFSLLFLRSTSSHPSLLVPNLRVLKWRSKTRPFLSIKFIQRFLTPSLVSLNVTLNDVDDARLQSFLAGYPSLCPDLKTIVINVSGRKQVSSTTVGTLSRAIPHHEHLESLDVSVPIDNVALTHVAMSPAFKRLALVLHPDMSSLRQICIPSDITPFRNVEELFLEVWDINFVTSLLRTHDQVFRSFMLRHHSPPTTDAASAFFTALASRQRTRSLRSISLTPVMPDCVDVEGLHSASGESGELAMHCHLTYDTLRPLTFLSHLRELVIDLGRWFSIDDDDLVSLARSWPLLQVLHLNRRRHAQGHPWRLVKHVTFKGLTSLLECCPNLHNFCLPLDAREVLVNAGKTIGNTAVTYIHSPNTPTVILVCWKKI